MPQLATTYCRQKHFACVLSTHVTLVKHYLKKDI
jgi:hypothetical protein